jgi:hypothetical protein
MMSSKENIASSSVGLKNSRNTIAAMNSAINKPTSSIVTASVIGTPGQVGAPKGNRNAAKDYVAKGVDSLKGVVAGVKAQTSNISSARYETRKKAVSANEVKAKDAFSEAKYKTATSLGASTSSAAKFANSNSKMDQAITNIVKKNYDLKDAINRNKPLIEAKVNQIKASATAVKNVASAQYYDKRYHAYAARDKAATAVSSAANTIKEKASIGAQKTKEAVKSAGNAINAAANKTKSEAKSAMKVAKKYAKGN